MPGGGLGFVLEELDGLVHGPEAVMHGGGRVVDLCWHLPSGLIDRSYRPTLATAQLDRIAELLQKVGLRPEHIGILPDARPGTVAVTGTLRFCEHMGAEVFVYFDVGAQAFSARINADQIGDLLRAPRGSQHAFQFQMGQAHLFDARTGVALR